MATGKEGLETGSAGESPPSGRGVSNPVLILLVWLVGISGGLLLYWGSKLTFLLDDWEFLLYRRGFNSHAILDPHGEHIVVIPVLVYKALLAVFGMGSALPFRVVSTGLFLLSAVLLFVFLKRRVGEWPALAATAVVLFLGAAWEDLLWSFQIGYFGCMAAGIGALLALEREGRRRDVIATILLSLGILLSSLGLSFIAGAAVQVLRREDRWRRLWVFLVPLAIYAIWYLGWGHTAEHAASWANFAKTPAFILNSLAASLASAFGLFLPAASESPGGLDWGRPILVGLALLGAWRLAKLGKAPRWLWVVVAIGGSFWFLAGLNQIPGRDPTASRYQYIGVVFVLLIAAELLRGIKLSPRVTVVVVLVAAAAVAPNVYYLHQAYLSYRGTSQLEKADLGALDIARETVEPGFVLDEDVADTGYVHVDAGSYFSAEDEFGTPAYSSEELEDASEPARFAADKVLWAALRPEVEPIPASQVPTQGCTDRPAPRGTAAAPDFAFLPPGGGIVVAGDEPFEDVKLARFSSGEAPIDLQQRIEPGAGLRITIPADRSTVEWRVLLETSGPSKICDLAGR